MSDILTVKLSTIHGIIAVVVLLFGGGGVFAVSRRNSGRTRQADPEAIELVVSAAVEPEDNDALDALDAADASA